MSLIRARLGTAAHFCQVVVLKPGSLKQERAGAGDGIIIIINFLFVTVTCNVKPGMLLKSKEPRGPKTPNSTPETQDRVTVGDGGVHGFLWIIHLVTLKPRVE